MQKCTGCSIKNPMLGAAQKKGNYDFVKVMFKTFSIFKTYIKTFSWFLVFWLWISFLQGVPEQMINSQIGGYLHTKNIPV